jgi:predicted outer membrane repeat protein
LVAVRVTSYDNAAVGGGIANNGTLTLIDSTLSGHRATANNGASSAGGGILNQGTLTVIKSTISGNSATYGGGIYSGGNVKIRNTLLAGNTARLDGPDVSGVITSLGHNLNSDGGTPVGRPPSERRCGRSASRL